MPSCPRCGALQAERTAFCAACGALIDRPDTATAVTEPATSDQVGPVQQPVHRNEPLSKADVARPQRRAVAGAPPQAASHDFGDIGLYIVRRFLALLVDLAGIGALIGIALVAAVDARQAQPDQYLAVHAREFAIALGTSLFAYLTLAETLVGSTVGKGLFGLGVGRLDGGRVGFARAIVRNAVLPLDLALVGFLVAAVTPRRRRLGDLVAGTVVSNARLGRLAPVLAAAVGVAAAWVIFGNADGARSSAQLIGMAGLRLPVGQGRPLQAPSQSVPAPSQSVPVPSQSVPPPSQSVPAPSQSVPPPTIGQTRPSPSPSVPPGPQQPI